MNAESLNLSTSSGASDPAGIFNCVTRQRPNRVLSSCQTDGEQVVASSGEVVKSRCDVG